MAHYLAEVIQESERLEGEARVAAEKRAVDLILRLWERRQSLPNCAYPLNALREVTSVLGRLESGTSPFSGGSRSQQEVLLAKVYEGLQLIVIQGVLAIAGTKKLGEDVDPVKTFLDAEERQFLEAVEGWIKYCDGRQRAPSVVVVEASGVEKGRELEELESLPEEEKERRVLARDIDALIVTLTELKESLASIGDLCEDRSSCGS